MDSFQEWLEAQIEFKRQSWLALSPEGQGAAKAFIETLERYRYLNTTHQLGGHAKTDLKQ